jgi:hypothetical protein
MTGGMTGTAQARTGTTRRTVWLHHVRIGEHCMTGSVKALCGDRACSHHVRTSEHCMTGGVTALCGAHQRAPHDGWCDGAVWDNVWMHRASTCERRVTGGVTALCTRNGKDGRD